MSEQAEDFAPMFEASVKSRRDSNGAIRAVEEPMWLVARLPSSDPAPGTMERSTARRCSTPYSLRATVSGMKAYIHARLDREDRAALDELKQSTGQTESEIVRRGLLLVAEEERRRPSALTLAGRSVGRFKTGPRDLSTDRTHLEGFGE